jgi:hypothetical protein
LKNEVLLTRLVVMIEKMNADKEVAEKMLLDKVTRLNGQVATLTEAQAQQDANLLKVAELTSEWTRMLTVFNMFVMHVKSRSIVPASDVSDDLFKVPVQPVPALAAHLGDKSLCYPVLDNAGIEIVKENWTLLPYQPGFPEEKKVKAATVFQYRAGVHHLCPARQAAARTTAKEFDPDVLMPAVDMSDVGFIRVIFNSKGVVMDVQWPSVPLIPGPHNDPVPRVLAHSGRITVSFADRLPPPPPRHVPAALTGALLSTGPQIQPMVARATEAENFNRVAGDVEVSPGGLPGRESGNGAAGASLSDSVLLMRRMEELCDQVASQKRALEVMHAKQTEPRKKPNSLLVQDSISTIIALSTMDGVHQQGTPIIYQQALVPLEKWTGKETDKIRDGSKWIRQAIRQAKRTNIPLVEFLEMSVEGPGQAWADGLSREYSRYVLQQTQEKAGDLLVINQEATYQGKPVSLAPAITEEYVLADFHKQFMHNKVNQVEASQVSLFGGSLTQGPKESFADFILRFKAKVWDANLVLEENHKQMISLVYRGLQPYLQQWGYNERKTGALFETFASYEEFLTEKEATVLRMKHFQGLTPGLPLKVARFQTTASHHDRAMEPQFDRAMEPQFEDDFSDYHVDPEEEDYYSSGMINALGSRQPVRQQRTPSTAQQVTIPGPTVGSQSIMVRKRDVAFFLKFATDSTDWPSNGTPFSGPLKSNEVAGARPGIKEQVMQLMKFLRPTIQDATVTGIFDTAKAHNRDWVWCIFHGSTAHHTHKCPCLAKAFPARTPMYERNKTEYKKQVNVMKRQEGSYSGEDNE